MSPSHNPLHQHSHTKWKQPYCPRLPAPVKCPEMIPKTLTHFHVHAPTLWMLLNHIILLCISKHTYTFAKRHTHTHTQSQRTIRGNTDTDGCLKARTQTHIHTYSEKINSWCLLDGATGLSDRTHYAKFQHPLLVVVCESLKKYNGGNLISVHSAQQMITLHVVFCSCWHSLCVNEDILENVSSHLSHLSSPKLDCLHVMEHIC